MVSIERRPSDSLTPAEHAALRELLDAAFATAEDPGFEDSDWAHALGGTHVIARDGDDLLAHASVVPRTLHIGGKGTSTAWSCGYVEAVCTRPDLGGTGIGSKVMRELDEVLVATYDIGALGTGSAHFYERLGWEVWRGPTYVVRASGWDRSAGDDGGVMVLRHGPSLAVDVEAPIACEERDGEDW